jgi:hypothetical protein
MTQIHQLVTRGEKISEETLAILEDYLEMAKRGEIVAVAVCAVCPDGTATHQAGANDYQVTLLGAVSRLLHRMQISADSVTSRI